MLKRYGQLKKDLVEILRLSWTTKSQNNRSSNYVLGYKTMNSHANLHYCSAREAQEGKTLPH